MRKSIVLLLIVMGLVLPAQAHAQSSGQIPRLSQRAYFTAIKEYGEVAGPLMTEFADLSSEAGDDPTVMFTQRWKREMRGVIDDLHEINQEAYTIFPPVRYDDLHRTFIAAAALTDAGMTHMEQSIDSIDVEEAKTSGYLIRLGTDAFLVFAENMPK